MAEARPAVEALKRRAARRLARARRAPVGSNERRKCEAEATLLTQAVIEIEKDKKLAKRVEGGWKRALETTVEYVRERERRAEIRRATKR